MRICVVGGTGLIGSAVADALADRHEMVRVGHSSGEHRVDIGSKESIEGDRNGDVIDARDFA